MKNNIYLKVHSQKKLKSFVSNISCLLSSGNWYIPYMHMYIFIHNIHTCICTFRVIPAKFNKGPEMMFSNLQFLPFVCFYERSIS